MARVMASPKLQYSSLREKCLMAFSKWDLDALPLSYAWKNGKRIRLLKTLYSSVCKNSCKYCALRRERRVCRTTWRTEKLVNLTLNLWKRDIVSGLFLSSGVFSDPENVVEKEIEIAFLLREKGFNGYINLRLMPGTPRRLIWEAARVADRIGVNIEAVDSSLFYEIAPDKGSYKQDILRILETSSRAWMTLRSKGCLKAGVATQMIVGLGENDKQVISTTFNLIKHLKITRVYYSPFTPIKGTPLESKPPCPKDRVKRLYQAFFLMKHYAFKLRDLQSLLDTTAMFPKVRDLKLFFSVTHKYLYPIDLNEASYIDLLKVPGIGPRRARKLIFLRENGVNINRDVLMKVLGMKNYRKASKYIVY